MSMLSKQCRVFLFPRLTHLLEEFARLLVKESHKLAKNLPIATHLSQQLVHVDKHQGLIPFGDEEWGRRGSDTAEESLQNLEQEVLIDRLRQIAIHSRIEATLFVFGHGMSGDGDDRQVAARFDFHLTNDSGRFDSPISGICKSIRMRSVEWCWMTSITSSPVLHQMISCPSRVASRRETLVDLVVLGKDDPRGMRGAV